MYANIEDKRRNQREWRRRKRKTDSVWHKRELETKRRYGHPEFQGARGAETRFAINERRHRFAMREVLKHQELAELLTFVTKQELIQPIYVFELNGKRKVEYLNAPLPVW